MALTLSKKQRSLHVEMLHSYGEGGFYQRAIGAGMMKSANSSNPEVRMLDISEAFMALYRTTGNNDYFTISKSLRRAAHVVYRQLLKHNKDKKSNVKRFITTVA